MRRIGDVSVGEQDEFRLDRASLDFGQALAHRRELAGPTRRRAGSRDDLEAIGRLSFARRSRRGGGCAVCALVVDDDHGERPRIVLPKQRADAQGDHVGFVARRDDRDDAGPSVAARCRGGGIIALAAQPEPSPAEQKIGPYGERKERDGGDDHLR